MNLLKNISGDPDVIMETHNKLDLPNPQYFYRYDTVVINYPHFSGEHYVEGTFQVILNRYAVRSRTPKSVLIDDPKCWKTGQRRIHFNWSKKYAFETIEQAKKSFLRRKKAQIALLENQLLVAKGAYNAFAIATDEAILPSSFAPVKDVYGSLTSQLMFEDSLP